MKSKKQTKGRIKNEKLQKKINEGIDQLDTVIRESGRQILEVAVEAAVEHFSNVMTKKKKEIQKRIVEGKKKDAKKDKSKSKNKSR
jgi:predicted metal-dependent hydrolase